MPDSMGWAAVFVGRRIAVGMWRRADRDANARAYTGHQYPYADIGPANADPYADIGPANADPYADIGPANADPSADADPDPSANPLRRWRSRDR